MADPTVSLCMIVKNEAAALPRCLGSVAGWVDEIVIVDTGSTDRTPEIAVGFGARVVHWAWRDDFAAARNESLRHATGDWILVLDADEALAEGCAPRLRELIRNPEAVAYLVKIVCPRQGDGGLVRLNWFPRLFRNLPGVAFEGVIHEQVIGSLAGRGRIDYSDIIVEHAGYTLAPAELSAKGERNLRLLERQLNDDPTYAPGWFQLAETYMLLGRVDEAIDAYRRALRLLEVSSLTLSPRVVALALQNLGAAHLARGDTEKGIDHLREALLLDPDLPPAHVHLGLAALRRDDPGEAEKHFARALEIADRLNREQDPGREYEISPWLIHYLRACALGQQGKTDAVRDGLLAALRLNPDHAESLWLLALACSALKEWPQALEALEALSRQGRDDLPYHLQRVQVLQALERHDEAAAAALRALERGAASREALTLAAQALCRDGRWSEAADAYEKLARLVPDNPLPLLALAHCREAMGDRPGAFAAYERAAAIAPDAPPVLFALGSSCLRAGQLDEAVACLEEAAARGPDRPEYLVNLTLAHLKRGDMTRAREVLAELSARGRDLPQAAELDRLLHRVESAIEESCP
ncbi:MAG: tetratricopeptide repeat protein [Candidatus Rokubacteria bacterium]|nr:tetratricopeptide repeat protein [Candidatus Rokubacteria bacterium]